MLKIEKISFGYEKGMAVLQDISAHIPAGKITALVGPNGCGKSTLLKCLAGIYTPWQGEIILGGENLGKLSRGVRAKRCGYVPQESPKNLPGTVLEQVILGRRQSLAWRLRESDVALALKALQALGLTNLANTAYAALSAGQRQGVLMARAMVQSPEIYLLDEPTASLDLKHQRELMGQAELLAASGKTVLAAVHDLNLAKRFASHVLLMEKGGLISQGGAEEVLTPENIERVYGVSVKQEPSGFLNPYI